MKFTWNPLYRIWIGQDGKMYTTEEKEAYESKHGS